MKTIYVHDFCDDDFGEYQAFFELKQKKLKFLSGWSLNDADFRVEYMNTLLEHFKVQVRYLPDKFEPEAHRLVVNHVL